MWASRSSQGKQSPSDEGMSTRSDKVYVSCSRLSCYLIRWRGFHAESPVSGICNAPKLVVFDVGRKSSLYSILCIFHGLMRVCRLCNGSSLRDDGPSRMTERIVMLA